MYFSKSYGVSVLNLTCFKFIVKVKIDEYEVNKIM